VLPKYLEALLNSEIGKRIVIGEARGQIQQHFNVGSLKSAAIPVPALTCQHEFGARVRAIEARRADIERGRAADDELFASLQARAFAGDL
jgi:type I restriction enzyme S subunit